MQQYNRQTRKNNKRIKADRLNERQGSLEVTCKTMEDKTMYTPTL